MGLANSFDIKHRDICCESKKIKDQRTNKNATPKAASRVFYVSSLDEQEQKNLRVRKVTEAGAGSKATVYK